MFRRSALFLVLAFLLPTILCAAEGGSVEGKLTVGSKSIKFTHVYGIDQTNESGEHFYKILFSDVALTDKDLTFFPDAHMELINGDKLHVMKLGLDSARHFHAVDLFVPNSFPTIEKPAVFDLTKFEGKVLAGRVHLDKPFHDMDGNTYQFDVKFSVPLRPDTDFLP